MKIYTDLHIHTALSPCGSEDMTPNNIVNMAMLKGLDAIAITDHNSCKNVIATKEVGDRKGLIIIPGIEVQTKEDVHIICLFRNVNMMSEFQNIIFDSMQCVENNEKVLGEQLIFNELDEVIGKENRMLLLSVNLSINDVFNLVKKFNGIFMPAHIDQNSFSIISSLGFIPKDIEVKNVDYRSEDIVKKLIKNGLINERIRRICSSDAHYLWEINEAIYYIEAKKRDIDSIFETLESI